MTWLGILSPLLHCGAALASAGFLPVPAWPQRVFHGRWCRRFSLAWGAALGVASELDLLQAVVTKVSANMNANDFMRVSVPKKLLGAYWTLAVSQMNSMPLPSNRGTVLCT